MNKHHATSNVRSLTLASPFSEPEATAQEAIAMVTMVAACFPESEADDSVRELRMQGYLMAVEGYQASVLHEVTRKLIRGDAGVDKRFMPTPPQIRSLCDQTRAEMHIRAEQARRGPPTPEPPKAEETEAELQRRAEKAAAASWLIDATLATKDIRRLVPSRRGESEGAAEARGRAAGLVPMTDAEIEALKREMEETAA